MVSTQSKPKQITYMYMHTWVREHTCKHTYSAPPKEGFLNGRQLRCVPSFLWMVPSLIARESPMAWVALLGGFVFG